VSSLLIFQLAIMALALQVKALALGLLALLTSLLNKPPIELNPILLEIRSS